MSRSQEDTIEAEKYKNAILYFFKSCNNKYLGATKLNKLMYYLDFVSYRDKKKSVTGDVYLHLDYGPVPKTINNFLVKMKADELINAEDIPFKGTKKKEFTALVDPDVSVFDEYEKGLLDAICKEFQLWDTQKIVEQTHLESPWLYSEPLDTVDYEYSSDIDLFAGLSHASA